jgi:hypothetical protein
MARGDKGRPDKPPREMLGMAADLGDVRVYEPGEFAPAATSVYANDCQPIVESDGNLTVLFRHNTRGGEGPVTGITMPMGLFMELCQLGPQFAVGAAERYLKQGQDMATIARASGVMEEGGERRGGSPVDLESRRG